LSITTNLYFGVWVQVFGDARMTKALMDRIAYHCDIMETDNDFYRLTPARQDFLRKPKWDTSDFSSGKSWRAC